MRLVPPARLLPPRLVAAAIVFAAGAVVVASGQACDKHASARAACPMTASCPASACTASMCSPAKSATAAVTAANHACSHRTTAVSARRRAAAPVRRPATAARATKSTRRATAAATTTAAPRAATTAAPHGAGLVAVIDPMTGGVAQATPDQLRDLAAGMKTGSFSLAARPADPEVVRWADGTLVSRVPDRFTMFAMGHRDARGKITFDCSQEPGAPVPPVESTPQTWEVK